MMQASPLCHPSLAHGQKLEVLVIKFDPRVPLHGPDTHVNGIASPADGQCSDGEKPCVGEHPPERTVRSGL